jgi:hypothetical protein
LAQEHDNLAVRPPHPRSNKTNFREPLTGEVRRPLLGTRVNKTVHTSSYLFATTTAFCTAVGLCRIHGMEDSLWTTAPASVNPCVFRSIPLRTTLMLQLGARVALPRFQVRQIPQVAFATYPCLGEMYVHQGTKLANKVEQKIMNFPLYSDQVDASLRSGSSLRGAAVGSGAVPQGA